MTARQIAYRLKAEGKAEVLRDAREVGQAFKESYSAAEQGATAATAAQDRLEKRYRAMAQAAQDSAQAQAAQARINAQLGVQEPVRGSAAASAAVFMQDDTDVRRVEALRAAIDPLTAAQTKLNHELREYQTLANAGKITTGELAQLQGRARVRFDETAAAIDRNNRGLTRLALASRLNLARQGADVLVTGAMGMNPAMIAIQQGPQILDALATSGIKANASMIALAAGLGAAAAAVVLVGGAWAKGLDAQATYEDATRGVGRTAGLTADQLRDLTVAAADAGGVSRSAGREMAAQFLATGQIGSEVLGGLIGLQKDWASFMQTDAQQATKDLASAMLDPKKAAHDLTLQMGLLTEEQIRNIDTLVEQGDLLGAQKALFDELSRTMAGHAGQAREVSDAWQWIGREVSNAVDALGEWILLTDQERLQQQIDFRGSIERRGGPRGVSEQNAYDQAGARAQAILDQRKRDAEASSRAIENQQGERDRQAAARREREGRGAASRAAAAARREASEREREERESLQRRRREQDRDAQIAMEVARGRGDVDGLRALEDANAVRARERQLIDDGTSAEKARTDALAEQKVLIEARAGATEREVEAIFRSNAIEIDRVLGNNRLVAESERHAELVERINGYVQKGSGYYAAWLQAARDLKDVDEARAEVAQRTADIREREWRMTLAQASGDRPGLQRLERDAWIERRAREIEADPRKPMDFGGGDDQAADEYGQLMRAETTGAMRDGLTGLIEDIRGGGLREALASQFDNAADRLLDKLMDGLFDMDWGAMLKGGGGGDGGAAGWLSKGFNFLFGRNAEGTDFWTGGPTWVGERGPELLDLPRGSRVTESARSMQQMRRAAGGGNGGTIVQQITNDFRGAIVSEDVMAQMDAKAKAAADAAVQKAGQEAPLRTIAYMRDRHMLSR